MSQPPSDLAEPWKTRIAWLLMLVGISFSYLYFIPYFATLNNPNENSRVYQVRAYVELGKLSVDEQVKQYGWVNDLAKREGKLYAGKAPATTFIGVPIYAALRASDEARGLPTPSWFRVVYTLRLFGVILPCLLFVHLFRGFVRRIVRDANVASLLAIVLALGTMLLPYGLMFVNHSLSAASAFGTVIAVHAALRAREGTTKWSRVKSWLCFGLAGFLLAGTTALDYALFPVSVMLLGFVFWRARWSWASVAGTCLGAAIPSLLTAAYHQACWGSPFAVSMSFLANPQFAAEANKGVFGIIGPTTASVWGVFGSAKKGLLYFSPVLAPGLLAVVISALTSRYRKESTVTFAIVLWMLLYNVSLINWAAGWTVGPRYVTVIIPFVLFAFALWMREMKPASRHVTMAIAAGLSISSVAVTAATSTMFPHLQPDYDNPVFECIWPLWRDGFTPRSLGRWAASLSGHADQTPFLVVVGLLLIGMLVMVGRAWHRGSHAWLRSAAGVALAATLASATLWVQSLPVSKDQKLVQRGSHWLRMRAWDPPVAGTRRPKPPRR